ncbi:hypothetical protein ACLMJK_000052 [Lecanora helva]
MYSAQHNASSLLLRLPPEIRNVIYDYTFESRYVLIQEGAQRRKTWKGQKSRIQYENFIGWEISPAEREAKLASWDNDLLIRHRLCGWDCAHKCHMRFLIYAETALIAFQKNTIAFESSDTLLGWLQTLSPLQAAALRNLYIQTYPWDDWEEAMVYLLGRVEGQLRIEFELDEWEYGEYSEDNLPEEMLKIARLSPQHVTMVFRHFKATLATFCGGKEVR